MTQARGSPLPVTWENPRSGTRQPWNGNKVKNDILSKEIGLRGFISLEAGQLKDFRDRYQRSRSLGCEGVEDRYGSDVTFCDRIHQEGKDVSN